MPRLSVQPVDPNRHALIVGNGPSSHVLPWTAVWRWLAQRHGVWPDPFLMNRTALGRTHGRFAVAVGPEVLEEYGAARLHEHTPLLTRDPGAIVHPDRQAATFGAFLQDPRSVFAPADWPPHASGPLATWGAAALGYGTVFLYGLDGTAGPPGAESDFMHKAHAWENGIRNWRNARGDALDPVQQVVRIWPKGHGVALPRDPLRPALAWSIEAAP